MTIRHLFSLLLTVAVIPIAAFGHPTTLLYDTPAKEWMQSLPVGNGRLGLNVFGDPHCETLWLNEATLCSVCLSSGVRAISIPRWQWLSMSAHRPIIKQVDLCLSNSDLT
ncbi:MAG: glycoside hydrolase family 95 protein [Bacteroidales bacterium]|nr:glycoside hydrolase family 95 protein [Bacteroidales bacterium]